MVGAIEAMRGVSFISAVTVMAETGDPGRFDKPRLLMSWRRLVPSEHASGPRTVRGGISKAGSKDARRMLIEGAWTCRRHAAVGKEHMARLEGRPQEIRDIARKAQIGLCARYRRLSARGKPATLVVTAIARELAAFIWAIARTVTPDTRPAAAAACREKAGADTPRHPRRVSLGAEPSGTPGGSLVAGGSLGSVDTRRKTVGKRRDGSTVIRCPTRASECDLPSSEGTANSHPRRTHPRSPAPETAPDHRLARRP